MYPSPASIVGGLMASSVIANAEFTNPSTGRFFFVGNPSLAIMSEVKAVQGTAYPDGTPIVYDTITLALAACVASRGDTIIVVPGHTETVIAAAGIAVNKAGVSIFGLGIGTLNPTITFTTAVGASFDISAANVFIQNLTFTCGIDNQTAMVNVTATDVRFAGCTFNTNSATVGAALGISAAATSDRLQVNNCRFVGPAVNTGTTTTAQIKYEATVDFVIQNSYFTGKMTQAIVNVATVLRGLIFNNNFVIATGTKAIAVAAASTPFISSNNINVPSGTAPVVAAAGFVVNNRYSAAAGVTAGTASTF